MHTRATADWRPMYLEYWHLRDFPFDNAAGERYFFESSQHHVAYDDLMDGIHRRKGVILLTGDIGCGKSTLLQRVLLSLPASAYDIALIAYPRLEPGEMLAEVARQLGIQEDSKETSVLLHRIQDLLAVNAEQNRHTLICIDEAQSIPDLETFEELRLLLNFQLDGRFLITLVFVGQPELSTIIAKLPPLQQRIALALHLRPFDLEGTTHYILHRLRMAGYDNPFLTRQAVESIYRLTEGVPRRINHLMDNCLIMGMRNHADRIDSNLVSQTAQRYAVA
jgi:general secretion pathway protein A